MSQSPKRKPAPVVSQPVSHHLLVERESRVGVASSWLTIAASFVLSFATWVSLGRLAGFGELAWAMPACVDGYVVTALMTWMAPVSEKVARFARVNTYAAAFAGVIAQSAFHAFSIWTASHKVWMATLAAAVGMLPPLVAALAVHMRALVRRAAIKEVVAPAPAPVHATTTTSQVKPMSQPVSHVAPVVSQPVVAPDVAPALPVSPPVVAVADVAVSQPDVAPEPAVARGPQRSWDRDKAIAMLKEGTSCADVAAAVGVNKKTIERLKTKINEEAA